MPTDSVAVLAAGKCLDGLASKLNAPMLQELEILREAVSHAIQSLRPSMRGGTISEDLCSEIKTFSSRLHSMINEYNNGHEFRHYYNYLLDVSHDIHWQMADDEVVAILKQHGDNVQKEKVKLKKARRDEAVAKRNLQLHEIARAYGLRSAGHISTDRAPSDVICVDAYTHKPLDPSSMCIEGIDSKSIDTASDIEASGSTAGVLTKSPSKLKGKKKVKRRERERQKREAQAKASKPSGSNLSIPPPAMENPFPSEGFVTKEMIHDANFKVYQRGTVYGFARAPNGVYSMVWAVQFSPADSFSPVEREAVEVFIEYMNLVQAHAHEVKNNRAQNGNKALRTEGQNTSETARKVANIRYGRLFGSGWRPGRAPGEAGGEYAPQSHHDKHDPEGYIDMHEKQEVVNALPVLQIAWMILQERLSPRAVMNNVEALADTPVPLFGSHDSDISTHGPSLGANMSVSMHDSAGRNFANSMHVDRDIDSLPEFQGKVATMGQWINTKEGKLIEGTELRRAIPDGYFVMAGYRVAFDLGAAALITAMWRGGMDLHGTSTSVTQDPKITRWGMSIQTNKKLPNAMRSGKGALFGAYDRLRKYYDAMFTSDD
ncbi:hypothetical protein FRC12_018208 [Ceratobasidium sp. 428]|nr:hypothetical protein FRC12_018208 [Ceratobasidium sp. 428]